MISFPLLRTTIKSNLVIWLIFAAILAMYLSIILSMFDPGMRDSMDALVESLPPQLVEALNFKTADPSLLGFVAGYFYGFLILLFPMIYSVIMADRMIARFVDSGSMAFLLSTPNTRVKIAFTQAVFLIGSLVLLIAFVMLIGIGVSFSLFPGELDVNRFIVLNIGAALLYFALGSIGFFASCLFNESKYSLALGGGVPIAFLLVQMLSGVGEELSGLQNFSLLALFNPSEIVVGGSSVLPSLAALILIGLVLYSAGIIVFSKKDLPI
ncbi:MAG: ABC transporter permease subunit [Anaerolineales bacterium]